MLEGTTHHWSSPELIFHEEMVRIPVMNVRDMITCAGNELRKRFPGLLVKTKTGKTNRKGFTGEQKAYLRRFACKGGYYVAWYRIEDV